VIEYLHSDAFEAFVGDGGQGIDGLIRLGHESVESVMVFAGDLELLEFLRSEDFKFTVFVGED
jgi:hypothetical protein